MNSLVKSVTTDDEEGLKLACLSIQFPLSLLLADGATLEVFTTAEFEAALSQEASVPAVDFVYPLTVATPEDGNVEVADVEELGLLFGACIPDAGCGETTTHYFVLPIRVADEAGEERLIESAAGFYDLFYACGGNVPPGTEGGIVIDISQLDSTDCDFEQLTIASSYEVITEDGEVITVENENEEAALILSGEHYTINYPFGLVADDGVVITINSEEDFILLILPCLIDVGEPIDRCDNPAHILLYFNQGGDCGTVVYPSQLTAGGNTFELNTFEKYFSIYNAYPWGEIDIVYPVSVTRPDGSILTFHNDEEACDHIAECTE